jgi:hypothetical protein
MSGSAPHTPFRLEEIAAALLTSVGTDVAPAQRRSYHIVGVHSRGTLRASLRPSDSLSCSV